MNLLLCSSNFPNAFCAREEGDSSLARKSCENSTVKCDWLPTTHIGNIGFFKLLPTCNKDSSL